MIFLLYFLLVPALIIAKLIGAVTFGWVWVLAPLWAPILGAIILFILFFIWFAIAELVRG